MSDLTYNLNFTIKVKLKDTGYHLLADEHNEYSSVIKNWEKRDKEYYKNKADEDGYTEVQLWSFMKTFGATTGMGFEQKFDTNILIKSSDLQKSELKSTFRDMKLDELGVV